MYLQGHCNSKPCILNLDVLLYFEIGINFYILPPQKSWFLNFSALFSLFLGIIFMGFFFLFQDLSFPIFFSGGCVRCSGWKKGKKEKKKRRSSIAHPSWRRRWSRHGAKNFVDNESQTALLTMAGVDKYHLKK